MPATTKTEGTLISSLSLSSSLLGQESLLESCWQDLSSKAEEYPNEKPSDDRLAVAAADGFDGPCLLRRPPAKQHDPPA